MKIYKSNISHLKIVAEPSNIKKAKITSSKDAYDYAMQFWNEDIEIYESMFLLLLNVANNTIGWVKISQGGTSSTVVDKKIIAKYAIDFLANSIILFHNHPTGNINPSSNDIRITKEVKEGLKLLDIQILDHIVVSKDAYYSMGDNGIM